MAGAELAPAPPRERRDRARIAGVDEAGRGPLAGPVVAAAGILDPRRRIRGLADSKLLTAKERERLPPPPPPPAPALRPRLGGPGTSACLQHLPATPPS